MKKIKFLFFALLLSWLFIQPVKADYTDDDTCTQTTGLLNRIVDDITTLGLFEAYSESFHLYGAGGYGGSSGDGENGCLADYYYGNCASDQAVSSSGACMHNSSYCQPDGTNCCPDALNDQGLPTSSAVIGVAGGCAGDCNPDGGMEFCYDNYNFTTFTYTCNGDADEPVWAQNGYGPYWYYWPTGQMQVVSDGDKICAQFWTTLGYQNIGCKYLPSCSQFYLDQNCYVAESCYSYTAQKSLAMLPITGAIMQCINETIQYLFYGNPNCSIDNDSIGNNGGLEYVVTTFSVFQSQMRGAVRSALMLYIILFGLKTVLGSEHPSKGEFFRMGAQFTLVLYFSVGIGISGQVGANGQPLYDDGIHDYMIPLFTTGAAELADMVYSAGGSAGLCIYDSSLYPDGYSYLSMWDGIDCRLLYYFGIDLASVGESTVLSLSSFGSPTLLGLILPALFSFQLIFLFCTILFIIMFISVTIYFVNISIISAILVAILIYIAPIFVPMALFESTKDYYNGWLKTVSSYALQPMIIAAYIAMMFTIFDQTMFGDCVFQNKSVTFQMGGQEKQGIPFFMLCDPHDSTGSCYECEGASCPDYQTAANTSNPNITQCSQTIGYFLNPMVETSYTNVMPAIFFDITMLNSNVVGDMMTGLVTLCLFAYIFYKFADVLDEFMSELTGGASLGASAGRPMTLVDSANQKVKDFMKYATSTKKPQDKPRKEGDPNAKSSSADTKRSNTKSSSSDTKKSEAKSSSSDTATPKS